MIKKKTSQELLDDFPNKTCVYGGDGCQPKWLFGQYDIIEFIEYIQNYDRKRQKVVRKG